MQMLYLLLYVYVAIAIYYVFLLAASLQKDL